MTPAEAARAIVDATRPGLDVWDAHWAIRKHRAVLEKIASGELVVVEREHAETIRRRWTPPVVTPADTAAMRHLVAALAASRSAS